MAIHSHSFKFTGPADAAIEQETGLGTIVSNDPSPLITKEIAIEDNVLEDAKVSYRLRGWAYVGPLP